MASVFITGSNRWAALFFKSVLERFGHKVTSDWHNMRLVPTKDYHDNMKVCIADDSTNLIKNSDVLLVLDDPDMVPGGKFVDVGVMIGNEGKVILIGRRENPKMYNSQVVSVDTPEELLRELG